MPRYQLGGPDGWDEGDGKGEVIGGFLVGWKGWRRAKVLACLLACLLGRSGYGVGERCGIFGSILTLCVISLIFFEAGFLVGYRRRRRRDSIVLFAFCFAYRLVHTHIRLFHRPVAFSPRARLYESFS